MKDDAQEQRLVSRWALPASVAVHLSIVALVIFGLPVSLRQPDEEKAIEVDLVPPPKPEEKAKAEPPPPQEKPREPEQAKPKEPPPAQEEAARQAAQRVINPVFQFGEKDAGPREARDGNSPEEATAAPQAEREPEKLQEQQKPAQPPPALTASRSQNPIPEPQAPEKPAPKPADAENKQKAAGRKEAKKLFSQKATGDVIAMTGMGALPRGVRAGRLCVTELRDQLRNGLPPYYPDLLPSFRLEEGNVIDAPNAAFRVGGEWYDLSYRCEVDGNATRVVAFAFRVGDVLPPGERQRRGLPSR